MRKFFIILIIKGLLIALIINNNFIDIFYKNKTLQMQKDEYFNKLSLKYYGTENHGQKLALINQTVNFNAGSKEEDLIIPGLDALLHFNETYKMSLANDVIQKDLPEQIVESSSQNSIQLNFLESSIAHPFVGILIILAVVCGYILGRWKSKREAKSASLNYSFKNKNDLSTIYNKDELLINYKEKK